MPDVKAWTDRVHYAGAVVTYDGATWQAAIDTGRPPPAGDWTCLAAAGAAGQAGKDGAGFTLRGTWDAAETYAAGDVVALNGSSFVARSDEPGPCPGGGWQLWASRGSRGAPGERGAAGETGERGIPGRDGRDGASPVAFVLADDGRLVLTLSDGAEVTADLYPLLTRVAR